MLTKKKKQFFKTLLTQTLDNLLREAKKTVGGTNIPRDESRDLVDHAFVEIDSSFTFRIKERESRLIRKIKEALMRLEDGTFGMCQECGEEIAVKRLEARPIAALCINCKQKQENEENARRL